MLTFVLLLSHGIMLAECMIPHGSYKAAVVEYSPSKVSAYLAEDVLLNNAEEYVKYTNEAAKQGAEIIVFPEKGLTTTDALKKSVEELHSFSLEIPDPVNQPNPCNNESLHKILRLLACAAQEGSIYVVVNLIEHVREDGGRFYSTNVVFDKFGTIITRYRKINLLNEPHLTEGNELVTFTTDFNVTFGMFIGSDIFYRRPALEITKQKNVTVIIYSTAWFSETPFLQALSYQAGYARATGVNLLAAGLNNPKDRNGGSGIYLYDGKVAQLYVSPSESSKVLVQEVPKINIKLSAVKCNNNSQVMPGFRLGGHLRDGSFQMSTENMTHYTMSLLDQNSLETKKTLCNFNGMYCCKFHVILEKGLTVSDPVYRFAMFYGVRQFGDKTLGIRSCSLMACRTHDRHTCGVWKESHRSNARFAKISIEGDFPKSQRNYDQPITLTYDLTPVTEYTYCETLSDNKETVKAEMIATQTLTNMLTFGIHGRIYEYDGAPVGPITSSAEGFRCGVLALVVASFVTSSLQ